MSIFHGPSLSLFGAPLELNENGHITGQALRGDKYNWKDQFSALCQTYHIGNHIDAKL